ncbi:MAG: hypothetical protein M1834_005542 [Cirrosporium novae-zelandiae]|nr:MAG: hypothetical protein M1834_005542 [Cirrosporium novae-zelandiae]
MAGPETVVALSKMGISIAKRIESFFGAPKFLEELKTFGYDLHNGQLQMSVRLATALMAENATNERLKCIARAHLTRLQSSLEQAREELDKSVDTAGRINRFYFALHGRRQLRDIICNLDKWQNDFSMFIILTNVNKPILTRERLLTPQNFRTTTRCGGDYASRSGTMLHVWLAHAEIKGEDGKIREVEVMIERPGSDKIVPFSRRDNPQLKESTSYLAARLTSNDIKAGMLPCLGYRMKPRVELIFEIPPGLQNPRSLKSLIASRSQVSYRQRLRLASRLSEIIYSVHAAKLVHKSISPETIAILESSKGYTPNPNTANYRLGFLFLTSWGTSRATDDPSSWWGDDRWTKNIYQHPQRQGLHLEGRHTIGHDIYSLGVCLLEIGLWEPLIIGRAESLSMCDLYRQIAAKLNYIDTTESMELGRLIEPIVTQEVMFGLANKELGQRMSAKYVNIVTTCLRWVEDEASENKFLYQRDEDEDDNSAKLRRFKDLVVQPLSTLLLGR